MILREPEFFDDDVLFTARLRIARNIRNYPFPHQMTQKQAEKMVCEIVDSIAGISDEPVLVIPILETDRLMRELMVERHIISVEFAEDGFGKALIWFPFSGIRILVNEEDHLRISIHTGMRSPEEMWEILDTFDDRLSEKLEYAFDREFGYLTSCPTNLGSGLRVSSIFFLPSMKAVKKLNNIFDLLSKLGCFIRGFYGEGTSFIGNFYQISTGNVLGKKEKEICEDFSAIIHAIKNQELDARNYVDT